MRVCWFGAWDEAYPRNRILAAGLRGAGVEIREARVPERRVVFRYPQLAAAFARGGPVDALFVPAFRHKDVPLARLLAGRRPVVFDPLVSRHDTLVGDWKIHAERSLQAAWNRSIDRWSLRLPDAVLCDTWAHGRLYESLGAERARLYRVPVGAEDVFYQTPAPPAQATVVQVLYAGGFLPLHGVPVLIDALSLVERDATHVPEYHVRLIGRGIEFDRARSLASEAGLSRASFDGPRPYAELPATLATTHVVLGAFGSGAKAGRVIPHKVWQGMAAGRPVLTGDGEGLRELFEPGRDLIAVPRGDAAALAAALVSLLRDTELRERVGRAARERATELGTPARLGMLLREVLERVGRPR